VFAALAQRITFDRPLGRLKAALTRQPKGAEFPDDDAFVHALISQDIYGRRNLKFLLDRLTNVGKEKVHTENLTIEHVLPQKEVLPPEWQAMLGENWKIVRAQCLHKLGNLTLTGFNSELEARPFLTKKNHSEWGYINSPVWLSKSIATKEQWGPAEIDERSKLLAERALTVWKPLISDESMVKQIELEEAKERSAGYALDGLKWAKGTEEWFAVVRKGVLACADDVTELPRAKSVVYRAPDWFVEVIPRAKGFALRLAADVSDLADLSVDVQDAASWSFITHSTVTGGSLYVVTSAEQAMAACALIERTYDLMFA
jgi:predicted transport protein